MIPWIESHVFHLGPIPIQTWGTFVAAGFLIATWVASKRAKSKGLDDKVIWDLAFWLFLSSMIGARLFHVLFYEPVYYSTHLLEIIDPTKPGFAIMGGIIGGALAAWIYLRKKKLDFIAYADVMAWGLPLGCGIGRIGCFLIHDHPGTLTSFVGGVKYPDGQIRHDLGLELSILGFTIMLIFLALNRKKTWKPGFWVGAFLILDGVGRFFLDFLRIVDRRYAGLTPTQWLLILTTSLGVWLVAKSCKLKVGLRGRPMLKKQT